MKNPKKIILQKSEQYNIIKKYKFDFINNILPYTKNINNIIINYLYNENTLYCNKCINCIRELSLNAIEIRVSN